MAQEDVQRVPGAYSSPQRCNRRLCGESSCLLPKTSMTPPSLPLPLPLVSALIIIITHPGSQPPVSPIRRHITVASHPCSDQKPIKLHCTTFYKGECSGPRLSPSRPSVQASVVPISHRTNFCFLVSGWVHSGVSLWVKCHVECLVIYMWESIFWCQFPMQMKIFYRTIQYRAITRVHVFQEDDIFNSKTTKPILSTMPGSGVAIS